MLACGLCMQHRWLAAQGRSRMKAVRDIARQGGRLNDGCAQQQALSAGLAGRAALSGLDATEKRQNAGWQRGRLSLGPGRAATRGQKLRRRTSTKWVLMRAGKTGCRSNMGPTRWTSTSSCCTSNAWLSHPQALVQVSTQLMDTAPSSQWLLGLCCGTSCLR